MFNTSLYNEFTYNQSALKQYGETNLVNTSSLRVSGYRNKYGNSSLKGTGKTLLFASKTVRVPGSLIGKSFTSSGSRKTSSSFVQLIGKGNVDAKSIKQQRPVAKLYANSSLLASGNKKVSSSTKLIGKATTTSKPMKVIRSLSTKLPGKAQVRFYGVRKQPNIFIVRTESTLEALSSAKYNGKKQLITTSNLISDSFKIGYTLANLKGKSIITFHSGIRTVTKSSLKGTSSLEVIPLKVLIGITSLNGTSSIYNQAVSRVIGESRMLDDNSLLLGRGSKYGFTLASLYGYGYVDSKYALRTVSKAFLVGQGITQANVFKKASGWVYLNGNGYINSYPIIIVIAHSSLRGKGILTSDSFNHRWIYEEIEEVQWLTKNTPQTEWEEIKPSQTDWKKVIK